VPKSLRHSPYLRTEPLVLSTPDRGIERVYEHFDEAAVDSLLQITTACCRRGGLGGRKGVWCSSDDREASAFSQLANLTVYISWSIYLGNSALSVLHLNVTILSPIGA